MRRRRDRYLSRRATLLKTLTEYALMPADEEARRRLVREVNDGKNKDDAPKRSGKPGDLSTSVHGLRARALTERLAPHQIGRPRRIRCSRRFASTRR